MITYPNNGMEEGYVDYECRYTREESVQRVADLIVDTKRKRKCINMPLRFNGYCHGYVFSLPWPDRIDTGDDCFIAGFTKADIREIGQFVGNVNPTRINRWNEK